MMKDKIYRIVIELVVLSLCMFLVGCKNAEEQEKMKEPILDIQENVIDDEIQDEVLIEGEEYSMKVTMEYVCSELGMSKSDFDGIDFEDFVNEYNLTYEKIQREDVGFLLQCYKEDYGKIKIPDYSEMFANDSWISLTEENKNDIAIVIFEKSIDDETEAYIFDFEIGKIIITDCPDNIFENEIVGIADDEVKNGIINLLDLYNVYSWKVEKRKDLDINTVDDGYANWTLEIKFNNTEFYRLSGNGINDEYAPENLELFVEDLKALATSSSTENA